MKTQIELLTVLDLVTGEGEVIPDTKMAQLKHTTIFLNMNAKYRKK